MKSKLVRKLLIVSVLAALATPVWAVKAEARPSNAQIISWLNEHLGHPMVYHEGSRNGKLWYRNESSYKFSMNGKTLIIFRINHMCNHLDECTDLEDVNKFDLSKFHTIEDSQVSYHRIFNRHGRFAEIVYYGGGIDNNGLRVFTAIDENGDALLRKVRKALDDLILNNGGSESLY